MRRRIACREDRELRGFTYTVGSEWGCERGRSKDTCISGTGDLLCKGPDRITLIKSYSEPPYCSSSHVVCALGRSTPYIIDTRICKPCPGVRDTGTCVYKYVTFCRKLFDYHYTRCKTSKFIERPSKAWNYRRHRDEKRVPRAEEGRSVLYSLRPCIRRSDFFN